MVELGSASSVAVVAGGSDVVEVLVELGADASVGAEVVEVVVVEDVVVVEGAVVVVVDVEVGAVVVVVVVELVVVELVVVELVVVELVVVVATTITTSTVQVSSEPAAPVSLMTSSPPLVAVGDAVTVKSKCQAPVPPFTPVSPGA